MHRGARSALRLQIGAKVITGFKSKDPGVSHAAIDVLCALMQVRRSILARCHLNARQPMHDNYDLGQEKENKAVLLASKCDQSHAMMLSSHCAGRFWSALPRLWADTRD